MDVSKPRTLAEVTPSAHVHEESPEVSALVERAKTGDHQAFGDLMRLYERRIISIGTEASARTWMPRRGSS